MVRLEELEDEHFLEKPATTKDDALLADDDDEYTDTDSEISDVSDVGEPDESILDRIIALKDMVSPKTRAKIINVSSSIYNTTTTGITYSGKGLWIIATSVLLLGLPYALALGDEQQIQEEERQRLMMQEGAQGLISPGSDGQQQGGDAKPAL